MYGRIDLVLSSSIDHTLKALVNRTSWSIPTVRPVSGGGAITDARTCRVITLCGRPSRQRGDIGQSGPPDRTARTASQRLTRERKYRQRQTEPLTNHSYSWSCFASHRVCDSGGTVASRTAPETRAPAHLGRGVAGLNTKLNKLCSCSI